RLQRLATRQLLAFDEETGGHSGFRQIGYLFLLTRPHQVEDFRRMLAMWHRLGVREARWVSPEEARELAPVLEVSDVLGGTFCPSDGVASPVDLTSGYAAAARRSGARIREGEAVTGIDVRQRRVEAVTTSAGGRVA